MGLDRTQALLASLVAFVAWALLTDWLPSLRWIPHALVAGSLATVLGLLFLVAATSRGVHHSQLRTIQGRPVAWRDKETWEEEKAALLSRTE